jgi:NADPH-dependent 2,4-dienoyl-CoA reductase/sulfur reductase-like enzyme
MSSEQTVVVVGASLAGVRAAEAARRAGFSGRITLVGAETHFPPVDRPPLSKAVLADRDGTSPATLRVDESLAAELLLGRRATRLDVAGRVVHLADGSALRYDGLVVATGATPRMLPETADRTNVHVLRTVDDAHRLRAAVGAGTRVAVIGAGVLGCEIAATSRKLGAEVTLIDLFEQPMLRVLGPELAPVAARLHADHGVSLRLGRRVLGLRGTPVVDGVVLDGDEIVEADVVVVSVGVVPETEWLADSGLTLVDGVVCDESCFALNSGRSVVAAGDVARWAHPVLGRDIRVEHWTNAVSQGQAAGRNLAAAMAGRTDVEPYQALPYYWTDQYDWKIQFLGDLGEDIKVEEGELGGERFVVSFSSGGRVTGVLCVNWPNRIGRWRPKILAAATGADL